MGLRVKMGGEFEYGSSALRVDLQLEVEKAASLLGYNASGKSLVLRCIASRAETKLVESLFKLPKGVICDVDGEQKYAVVYVDHQILSAQLYELIRKTEEEAVELVEHIQDREIANSLKKTLRELTAPYQHYIERIRHLKDGADEYLLYKALKVVERVEEEVRREVEERGGDAGEEESMWDPKKFFPYRLYLRRTATGRLGLYWRDVRTGAEGYRLTDLSAGLSPALILLFAIYAYGNAYERPLYLLIEEPEAHASPPAAYLLGRWLRALSEDNKYLHVVVSTYSLDFVRGFGPPAYLIDVVENTIKKVGTWDGKVFVPFLGLGGYLSVLHVLQKSRRREPTQ